MHENDQQHTPPQEIVQVTTESETPLFSLSATQEKTLNDIAFSYMKKQKVEFNSANIKSVQELLVGDALRRGLEVSGKDFLAPEDNVKSLVDAGLKARQERINDARNYLSVITGEAHNSSSDKLGPYAIDRDVIAASRLELQRSTTGPIAEIDRLNEQKSSRQSLLPGLAEYALSSLPADQFPDAKVDMLTTDSERAKAVRNSLLSMAYRNSANPAISIEELQEFIKSASTPSEVIGNIPIADVASQIAAATGTPTTETAHYIRDLTTQIGDEFEEERILIGKRASGSERDFIYNRASKYLLLLHPALEERELIVNPDEATEGSHSLWSDELSTVVEGVRVPTLDGLSRAIRLNEAKGLTSSRFRQGIEAWKENGKAKRALEERRSRKSKQIERAEKELEAFSKADSELPHAAYQAAYAKYPMVNIEYGFARTKLNRYRRLLIERDEKLSIADEFEDALNSTDENVFEKPGEMLQETIRSHNTKLTAAKTRLNDSYVDAAEIFSEDLILTTQRGRVDMTEILTRLRNRPTQDLDGDVEELQKTLQKIQGDEREIIPLQNVAIGDTFKFIDKKLLDIEHSRQIRAEEDAKEENKDKPMTAARMRAARHDDKQEAELKELKSRLTLFTSMRERKGVPKIFYIWSLQKRLEAMTEVYDDRLKVDSLSEVGIDENTTRNEIAYRKQKMRAEVIRLPAEELKDAEPDVKQARDLWQEVLRINLDTQAFWPEYVPEKEEFREWMQGKIQEVADNKQVAFRERKAEVLSMVLAAFDNRFFMTDECVGLKGIDFIRSFKKRMEHGEAQIFEKDAEDDADRLYQFFTSEAKSVYGQTLQTRLNILKRELGELEEINPDRKLAEKLAALSLAKTT